MIGMKTMKQNARIYVAGHRGMVGSAICRTLNNAGYQHLVIRSSQELNLLCQKDVETFFKEEKPDYVFLAAARVGGILANSTHPADFIYQNLMIQNNVIHCAYTSGVKKLLFLGSSCIYPRDCPQPMKEEYLLTGMLETTNEAYAVAKIAGIKMCQTYYQQHQANFVSVMPTNLFGPNDNFDLDSSHVLPALIRKFHEGKLHWKASPKAEPKHTTVNIWGTGKPLREFLHVDDMADACLFVMKHVQAPDLYGHGITHLNVGSGKDISISALAEVIKEIVGFKGAIAYDTEKPDGTPRKLLDVSRLAKLGWQSKIEIQKGIEATYEWYLKEKAE